MGTVTFDETTLRRLGGQLAYSAKDYMTTEGRRANGAGFAEWLAQRRPKEAVIILKLLFEALDGAVSAAGVQFRPAEPDALRADARLNERQVEALRFLQKHQRIASQDLQALFPALAVETLRLDMAGLVDLGCVIKISDKRGAFYMLRKDGAQ